MANAIALVVLVIGLAVLGAMWRFLEATVGRWGLAAIFAAGVTGALFLLWERLSLAKVDNLWRRLHQAEADIEELGQRVQELEKKQRTD